MSDFDESVTNVASSQVRSLSSRGLALGLPDGLPDLRCTSADLGFDGVVAAMRSMACDVLGEACAIRTS